MTINKNIMRKIMKIYLLILLLWFPFTLNSQQSYVRNPRYKNLIQLAENNNFLGVVQAIQDGTPINMIDESGFTALHVVSWNGYIDIARFLLQQGADPNIESKAGNPPIRFATPTIRSLLIQYGAREPAPDLIVPKLFNTPRIYIENRSAPVTNTINNTITNISNFISNTTYISNTYYQYDYPKKSYDLLTQLDLEDSIALHNWDRDGNNSILQAAMDGDLDRIKELIAYGINPKGVNSRDDTALRFAAEYDHMDIVQFLIETVGIDVNASNVDGITALIMAALNNNKEMITYLMQMGANPNQTATATVDRTIDGEEIVSRVEGWTPLMATAQLGNMIALETLVDSNADINAVDTDNWNALMFAVQNGHLEAAEYLLDLGINYNIESIDKNTALSLAIDNDDTEMIELLEEVRAISSSVPLIRYDESTTNVTENVDVNSYEYYEDDDAYYYEDDEYNNTETDTDVS